MIRFRLFCRTFFKTVLNDYLRRVTKNRNEVERRTAWMGMIRSEYSTTALRDRTMVVVRQAKLNEIDDFCKFIYRVSNGEYKITTCFNVPRV